MVSFGELALPSAAARCGNVRGRSFSSHDAYSAALAAIAPAQSPCGTKRRVLALALRNVRALRRDDLVERFREAQIVLNDALARREHLPRPQHCRRDLSRLSILELVMVVVWLAPRRCRAVLLDAVVKSDKRLE